MITVEITKEELNKLLRGARSALEAAANCGASVADMKVLLARIEYLEGLE